MKWVRRLTKFFVLLSIVSLWMSSYGVVYATEVPDVNQQRPSDWAVNELFDAEACGILPLDWQTTLHNEVTKEQLAYIISGLEQKFIQVGLVKKEATYDIKGTTRKEVLDAYYQLLSLYGEHLEIKTNTLEYVNTFQIVTGQINENRPCTVQEASLFAMRFLKNVYSQLNEGSKGYVWKVTHKKHTVYLLGSIHVADERFYPFSKQLNSIIQEADKMVFEVDFNNTKGKAYMQQKQFYLDGTTLEDYVSKELYTQVVEVFKDKGFSEAQVAKYKPWVLAQFLLGISEQINEDATQQDTQLPFLDRYIYTKSILMNKDIIELEGYVFLADLFNGVSLQTQIESLEHNLSTLKDNEKDANTLQGTQLISHWIDGFVKGDNQEFENTYPKDEQLKQGDSMTKLLFDKRDKNMAKEVETYLNKEGDDTYCVVVGVGHLVGETGIVQQLTEKGYKVEAVNYNK